MSQKVTLVISLREARALVENLKKSSRKDYGKVVPRQTICIEFNVRGDDMIHTFEAFNTLSEHNPFSLI